MRFGTFFEKNYVCHFHVYQSLHHISGRQRNLYLEILLPHLHPHAPLDLFCLYPVSIHHGQFASIWYVASPGTRFIFISPGFSASLLNRG